MKYHFGTCAMLLVLLPLPAMGSIESGVRITDAYHPFQLWTAIIMAAIVLAALNIALIVNIRRRRRAEESLRESEHRYRLLAGITADAGVSGVIGPDNKLIHDWVHQGCGVDCGYSIEDLDTIEKWVSILHPGDRDTLKELWKNVKQGQSGSAELRMFARSGTLWWINLTISPVPGKKGGPIRIIAALKDITEKKLAEESRHHLQEQIAQIQKMDAIGRVSGGIAHDINNLLVPILLNADSTLLYPDIPAPIREEAEEIRSAALKAREMIKHLLAFSRKQVLVISRGDLNDTIRDFARLLRRTIREDIKVDLLVGDEPLPVQADPSQISQVLLNLACNAQDAMPSGGVLTIRTLLSSDPSVLYPDIAAELPVGPCALLTVEDTGTGMSEEVRSKVFEPFFTTKVQGAGCGLGLATVYGIIKQHSGAIHIQSCPGAGTLVSVFLPLSKCGETQINGDTPCIVSRGSRQITIAVAEDDEDVRRVVTRVLTRIGFKIIEATGSLQCLDALQNVSIPVDLLLTDIIMPGMNGRRLFEQLRKGRPDLKVVYMSGYSRDVLEQQDAFDHNARYLAKPFETDVLLKTIGEVLGPGDSQSCS